MRSQLGTMNTVRCAADQGGHDHVEVVQSLCQRLSGSLGGKGRTVVGMNYAGGDDPSVARLIRVKLDGQSIASQSEFVRVGQHLSACRVRQRLHGRGRLPAHDFLSQGALDDACAGPIVPQFCARI